MIDALEYLSEPRPHLGIPEAPDMSRKPPIALPHMKRTHLAMLFNDLGYRTGAEIGVCWGSYSRCLSVNNPEATIYSIDPWEVYPEYLEDYTEEKMERIYAIARKKLEGTGCVIIRKFSMDAVKDFDDASLDFVYIDANHEFQHVTNDIAEWSKKVRPGELCQVTTSHGTSASLFATSRASLVGGRTPTGSSRGSSLGASMARAGFG
jgi:hypothetical protein